MLEHCTILRNHEVAIKWKVTEGNCVSMNDGQHTTVWVKLHRK